MLPLCSQSIVSDDLTGNGTRGADAAGFEEAAPSSAEIMTEVPPARRRMLLAERGLQWLSLDSVQPCSSPTLPPFELRPCSSPAVRPHPFNSSPAGHCPHRTRLVAALLDRALEAAHGLFDSISETLDGVNDAPQLAGSGLPSKPLPVRPHSPFAVQIAGRLWEHPKGVFGCVNGTSTAPLRAARPCVEPMVLSAAAAPLRVLNLPDRTACARDCIKSAVHHYNPQPYAHFPISFRIAITPPTSKFPKPILSRLCQMPNRPTSDFDLLVSPRHRRCVPRAALGTEPACVAISYRVNLGRAPASESNREWRVNDCLLLRTANATACDGLWQGTIFFALVGPAGESDGAPASILRSGNVTSARGGQFEFAAQNLTECAGRVCMVWFASGVLWFCAMHWLLWSS